GLLLAAVGLSYAAVSLTASQHALVHSVGRVLFAGFIVFLTYVFLCFPHDNLESRLERQLVVGFALTTAVLWLVALPLVTELPVAGPLTDCGDTCPNNAFRVVSTPHAVSSALGLVLNLVSVAGLLGLAALLIGRARSSARLRRRLIAPLLCCIVLLALTYAAYSVLAELGLGGAEAFRRRGAVSARAMPL